MIIMWLPCRCLPSHCTENDTPSLFPSQHRITGVVEQMSSGLASQSIGVDIRISLRASRGLGWEMGRALSRLDQCGQMFRCIRCPGVQVIDQYPIFGRCSSNGRGYPDPTTLGVCEATRQH